MINLVRRWSLPAAFLTAALALTACAGNSGSPVPLALNQMSPAGFHGFGLSASSEGMLGATCPKQFLTCFTVSLSKGLIVYWCDGNSSKNPCGTTKNFKWSGNVCKTSSTTCGPIPQMKATWTGPFPCKPNPKRCGGVTTGDYETDTIKIGSPPPKLTMLYIYKQNIDLNGKLAAKIGLNVGK